MFEIFWLLYVLKRDNELAHHWSYRMDYEKCAINKLPKLNSARAWPKPK